MIERFHGQLKAALHATPEPQRWTEFLPIVLLGCCSAIKTDIVLLGCCSAIKTDLGFSSAELLCGTPFMFPGQMLTPVDLSDSDPSYINKLCSYFSNLPPISLRGQSISSSVPSDISNCTHVFIWNESIIEPSHHLILNHTPKIFIADVNGRKETISIDRIKKTFSENLIPEPVILRTFTRTPTSPHAPQTQHTHPTLHHKKWQKNTLAAKIIQN